MNASRELSVSAEAEAFGEMLESGLALSIEIRSSNDSRDRVVLQGGDVMGFGHALDSAWEDFLNSWEDVHGSRIVW